MAVPKYDELMKPLLAAVKDGEDNERYRFCHAELCHQN